MDADKPKLIIPGVERDPAEYPLMCGLCEARFRKDQMSAYDRHMAKCAQSEVAHRAEQFSPRKRFPFFRPDFGDAEFDRWVKDNREAIVERRKKM